MHNVSGNYLLSKFIKSIEFLYNFYIHALSFLGSKLHPSKHHKKPHQGLVLDANDGEQNHDALAIELGNRYRGMGVAVGGCGALSVLCALLPVAFNLSSTLQKLALFFELGFVLLMVLIVAIGIRSGIHGRWLHHRRIAEKLRYAELEKQIAASADVEQLEVTLRKILFEQIEYNKQKATQYESIEHFSEVFGWLGVTLAITAALAHLLGAHYNQLIFLTVFMPTLVGAIHGINGFLRLQDLGDDHAKTAVRLQQLKTDLESGVGPTKIGALADSTLKLLSNRDYEWALMAQRLGLKVV